LSQKEIEESLNLLQKDWDVDPILRQFMLGKITDVSDYSIKVKDVIFHIPYLASEKKYILWKCFWPDCHNCCDRQGRLPLTSDDLITIGKGLKYKKTSDFIKNETITTTWQDSSPSGQTTTMTTINLKRKKDETIQEDGTHISCRFLDEKGGCSMHPDRPGVCYLYPFSTWLENEKGMARVHATYQFTGDCPGFYLAEDMQQMKQELKDYSKIIYDYTLSSSRTMRENFGSVSFG
jgi:Fe-S-cluster containining protein